MQVDVPYGGASLGITVPDEQLECVVTPREIAPAADPAEEIRASIRAPVGTPPLPELVGPQEKLCLIVDDISRPTPVHIVLPVLLEELEAAGVPDTHIRIVFALGSHRKMTEGEMRARLGGRIFDRYRVGNSEFREPSKLRVLGTSESGVDIYLDRNVVEADRRIAVGNIVPHGAAGWSGGAKMIYPGVASEETVASYHMVSALIPENILGQIEPKSRTEIERWVEHVGLDFIVNTILTREQQLYRVVAGHYVQAQRLGVRYAEEIYAVPVRRRMDIAVVSSYPAESDFWQAGKGITGGELLVRDGGTLILVAPCNEGAGPHPTFIEYVGLDEPEKRLHDVMARGVDERGDEDPLALAVAVLVVRVRRRINVIVVSPGLADAEIRRAGFEPAATVREALDVALTRYERDARVGVMTHGGETLVRHE